MINLTKYVRKPLYVEAIQVTAKNFNEVAQWCEGAIHEFTERGRTHQFIDVNVTNPITPRQSQARVGDWILVTDTGYKVYTNKAFGNAFNIVEDPRAEDKAILASKGFTAEEIKQMFEDQSLKGTPLDTANVPVPTAPEPTRDSRIEDNAVGTKPMPEQPLPGDVEEPAKVPPVPENIEARDPNVVYPDSPETTA